MGNRLFSLHVLMYRKSYCTIPGVNTGGGGVGVSIMLKFYVKVLYVMGKELSGVLFCTQTGLVLPILLM